MTGSVAQVFVSDAAWSAALRGCGWRRAAAERWWLRRVSQFPAQLERLSTTLRVAAKRKPRHRLGMKLVEGAPLTVCDRDGTDDAPTWLVVDGVADFDVDRAAWQVGNAMDDVHWGPRQN